MPRRDELGPFEREVLQALTSKPNDAYGVAILRTMEDRTGRSISLGALYTTLERLERKGFIRSWWGDATAVRGGRRKRLYAVQSAGMRALNGVAPESAPSTTVPFGAAPLGA